VIVGGLGRWIPVVVVSVLVIPVGFGLIKALERVRLRRGVEPRIARRNSLAEVGMVGCTLPWLWMILTPLPGAGAVRLVPLVDLLTVLSADPAVAVAQIGGNLLVFAGFGVFAPIRWGIRWPAVVLVAAVASGLVETAQYVLDLGRVSSVDDVVLNAAGAGIGALFGSVIRGTPPQSIGAT
jgi:VanZ like family